MGERVWANDGYCFRKEDSSEEARVFGFVGSIRICSRADWDEIGYGNYVSSCGRAAVVLRLETGGCTIVTAARGFFWALGSFVIGG